MLRNGQTRILVIGRACSPGLRLLTRPVSQEGEEAVTNPVTRTYVRICGYVDEIYASFDAFVVDASIWKMTYVNCQNLSYSSDLEFW